MANSQLATSQDNVVLAESRPWSRALDMSSPTPGSLIGDRPSVMASTLVALGSMPITSCP
jgi:hypothetical protein